MSPAKRQELASLMARVGLREEDLQERFVRGGGPGGQKINKTSVCVVLTHVPTGLVVRCQESRSRELNRFLARRRLALKLEARVRGVESQLEQERERIRRQKRRRSRRAKERILEEKRLQAAKKAARRPPEGTDD